MAVHHRIFVPLGEDALTEIEGVGLRRSRVVGWRGRLLNLVVGHAESPDAETMAHTGHSSPQVIPVSPIDHGGQDIRVLETAVKEAEIHLQAWRDLIVVTDTKCMQLMGYLVTVGGLLVTGAASVVLTGGLPLYMAILPFLGGVAMLIGFAFGIRAITGEIPIIGMPPEKWADAIERKAGTREILVAKLEYLRGTIRRASKMSEDSQSNLKWAKEFCVWPIVGILFGGFVLVASNVTGYTRCDVIVPDPCAAAFRSLPEIKVTKNHPSP